jgi:Histidyl-tRNA synthetase
LLINSLGNEQSRQNYKQTLVDFLQSNSDKLSSESRSRLQINPLRILDSKDEQDIKLLESAPLIIDSLDFESKLHFEQVLNGLRELGINYEINNKLVRGLDYYSHTVFEFRSNYLGSQDSFGGGGRYDGLFEQLGGKPTPAVGFAFGLERLLLILEQINKLPPKQDKLDYYFIIQNNTYFNHAQKIASVLREKGFSATVEILRRSFKSQMREANKIGANYVVIIGESEYAENKITLKHLSTSVQETLSIEEFLELQK